MRHSPQIQHVGAANEEPADLAGAGGDIVDLGLLRAA